MNFEEYMHNITDEDKVAVMFHIDADGVCSGVLIAKAVERLRGRKIDLYFCQYTDYYLNQDSIEKLRKNNITKFIVVDQGVDSSPDPLIEVQSFADVMIVDHHDVNRKPIQDVVIVKTYQFNDMLSVNYPCSKFVYDLCNKIIDVSDLDWIASAGIIGDLGSKTWKDFLDNVRLKYGIDRDEDLLSKVAILIGTVKSYSVEKLIECFEVVYNAKKCEDVIYSDLGKFSEKVKEEIDVLITNSSNAEDLGGIIVYYIKPRYRIHSSLSTILSFDYIKNKPLVVVADYNDGKLALSARYQSGNISMHELLRYAVKDLENSAGGGHAPAAGGSIMKKDYEIFKKRLVEFMNNTHF